MAWNIAFPTFPEYIDTLQQLFENKKWVVHFLRGHYTLEYFRNSNGDERLRNIYQRATVACSYCVHDEKDMLPFVYNENERILSTPNHVMIIDDVLAIYMRKGKLLESLEIAFWILKGFIICFHRDLQSKFGVDQSEVHFAIQSAYLKASLLIRVS